MRIIAYRYAGAASYGVVIGDGIVTAGSLLGETLPTVDSVLRAGALDRLSDAVAGRDPDVGLDEIEYLPPVLAPGKVVCAGVNYASHRDESHATQAAHPTIFTRFADTHVGHGQALCHPAASTMFDYEGELAVIVGRPAYQVAEGDAMGVIAGYACYNDASVRDWQTHTTQWTPGKNFPGTGGFGPWMVTADDVPSVEALELTTRVNGEVRQHAGVDQLVFSIPQLIAYITAFTPLAPGDVIATGTPSGVGMFREPPAFLQPGDVVEVEVPGVGLLRNRVALGS